MNLKTRRARPPVESSEPVKVGRYYSVPCVFVAPWNRTLPIMGPLHEDREVIGFEEDHWHIDWRFVDTQWYRDAGKFSVRHGKVISAKNAGGPVVRRNLKCKREMPEFPAQVRGNQVHWLSKLEDVFAGTRLKTGMVCPHRGIPLAGCPVKNGVVVCPGHGLAWCAATGELLRRQNVKLRDAGRQKGNDNE